MTIFVSCLIVTSRHRWSLHPLVTVLSFSKTRDAKMSVIVVSEDDVVLC